MQNFLSEECTLPIEDRSRRYGIINPLISRITRISHNYHNQVQTVSSDSIDSLAFHMAIIGLAIMIGFILKQFLLLIESTSEDLEALGFLSGFPLFPLCTSPTLPLYSVHPLCGYTVVPVLLQRLNF